jgi:metallo-beta-lactamase class B
MTARSSARVIFVLSVLSVLFVVVAALHAVAVAVLLAQTAGIDEHIAAAKSAARTDHAVLFTSLCSAEPTGPGTGRRGAGAGQPAGAPPGPTPGPPAKESWHVEPVKVFDNLYFLGMKDYSAWAVTTSDGIIIIDTLFDYSVDDEIAEGLKKVGLKPETIKYAIVSHGHGDHSGGAKYLQDRFKARVLLSEPDWGLLDRGRGTRPARDPMSGVVTDGQKLTLGDETITMYITPGHTPGTISYLIPVKDKGAPHLVAEWGGTAFNFPRSPEAFRIYTASAQRFGDIAAKAGADAVISNHSDYDGSKTKIPALQARKPGDPNPYVIGTDGVKRYMKVAEECSKAWEIRAKNP